MASEVNSSWYVMLTEPQRERQAVIGLLARRFEAFGPSIYSKRVIRKNGKDMKDEYGRKKFEKIEKPMFPGYIFVRSSSALGRFTVAERVAGVSRFMRSGEGFATLKAGLVEAIRRDEVERLGSFERAFAESQKPRGALTIPFVPNGPARIDGGPYDDWVGKMLKHDKRGRVTMLLQMFGREVQVVVDGGQVKAA